MKRKFIYGVVIIAIVIGVLSCGIIETNDMTSKEIQSDVTVNTDGQVNEMAPKVNINYEINDNLANITVFGNYLNRNRLLWASYNEDDKLVSIEQQEIFAYPFKYQGELLNKYNRLIIWNDENNGPVINEIIKNEDE